jgi:uncharacterized iron-regulated protein
MGEQAVTKQSQPNVMKLIIIRVCDDQHAETQVADRVVVHGLHRGRPATDRYFLPDQRAVDNMLSSHMARKLSEKIEEKDAAYEAVAELG